MSRKTSAVPGLKKVKGRWKVRVTITHPSTGKRVERQEVLPLGATRREALLRLEELNDELNEGLAPHKNQRMTLEDYADEWLAARNLAARTRVAYTAAIANHLLPHLSGLGLVFADDVRRLHVQRWATELETCRQPDGSTYAHGTVRAWWRPGSMMLKDMAADLCIPDPTVRVRPPTRPHTHGAWHHETQPLTKEQLDRVLDDVRQHDAWYFPAILTMAWTGARESEIRGLRWEDVDLEANVVTVRTTKTARHGNADRPLPLHPEVAVVLHEHRRELVRTQHPGVSTGLVFPAQRGKQLSRGRLRVVLRRAQKRSGIDQRVRPHVLRRTLNVMLRRASSDTSLRLAWMGHTSEGVNRLYDHVYMEEKRAVLTALNVE